MFSKNLAAPIFLILPKEKEKIITSAKIRTQKASPVQRKKGPNRKSPVQRVVKDLQKFKNYQKFYIKGRASLQNAWTALLNSDLLEESCVKIQTFGLECKRSENKTHSSTNFNLSPLKNSDLGINLLQGSLQLYKF